MRVLRQLETIFGRTRAGGLVTGYGVIRVLLREGSPKATP